MVDMNNAPAWIRIGLGIFSIVVCGWWLMAAWGFWAHGNEMIAYLMGLISVGIGMLSIPVFKGKRWALTASLIIFFIAILLALWVASHLVEDFRAEKRMKNMTTGVER